MVGGGTNQKGLPAPPAPYLCVAQHWVSPLNGRHSKWETLQPPEQAAEVIIATHGQCQGLLTCVGDLKKRRHSEGNLGLTKPQHHLGCCHDSGYGRTWAPPAGHQEMQPGWGRKDSPSSLATSTTPIITGLDPRLLPLWGFGSMHRGSHPHTGYRCLGCQHG